MSNNKRISINWFFDQLVANRIIVIDGSTYWDKVKTKYEILLEQALEMYHDEIEQAELDAKEIVIIKECVQQSTSDASKYADGYSQGYATALKLVKWKIDNELTSNNEQR